MATREINAQEMFDLPNQTAEATLSTATEVVTLAKAEPSLGSGEKEALEEVVTSKEVLYQRLATRGRALANANLDPLVQGKADRWIDGAWGAYRDVFAAWRRLDPKYQPDPEGLERINNRVFGEGLGFLNCPYKEEWGESETRLRIIREEGGEQVTAKLGATPFLTNVKDAHKNYGEVLGITVPGVTIPPDEDVKSAMVDVRTALRFYATQVAATIRAKNPATQERANRLLKPLLERNNSRPRTESAASDTTDSNETQEG